MITTICISTHGGKGKFLLDYYETLKYGKDSGDKMIIT